MQAPPAPAAKRGPQPPPRGAVHALAHGAPRLLPPGAPPPPPSALAPAPAPAPHALFGSHVVRPPPGAPPPPPGYVPPPPGLLPAPRASQPQVSRGTAAEEKKAAVVPASVDGQGHRHRTGGRASRHRSRGQSRTRRNGRQHRSTSRSKARGGRSVSRSKSKAARGTSKGAAARVEKLRRKLIRTISAPDVHSSTTQRAVARKLLNKLIVCACEATEQQLRQQDRCVLNCSAGRVLCWCVRID